MAVGDVDTDDFDPMSFLTDFDFGEVDRLPSGQVVRTFQIVALDRDIEIAPGVFFSAWTYNGQVPGPTLSVHGGRSDQGGVHQCRLASAHYSFSRHS